MTPAVGRPKMVRLNPLGSRVYNGPRAGPPLTHFMTASGGLLLLGKTVASIFATGTLVAACALAAGSELDIRPSTQTVDPGQSITGKIINPSGKVAVALQDSVTHEILTCNYHSNAKTFSCPTPANQQGLFVVGVTDSGHSNQKTVKVPVAVTAIQDYAPQVSVQNKAKVGQDVVVSLLRWGARRGVTLKVFDAAHQEVMNRRATTDASGKASTALSDLAAGDYRLEVSDSLWTVGGVFGPKVNLSVDK